MCKCMQEVLKCFYFAVMEIQQINTDDALSYNFPMQRTTWANEYATWKNSKASVVIPPTIFNNTLRKYHIQCYVNATVNIYSYDQVGRLMSFIIVLLLRSEGPGMEKIFNF